MPVNCGIGGQDLWLFFVTLSLDSANDLISQQLQQEKPRRKGGVRGSVTLHFDRQTAARGFAVFGIHVFTGFVHGLDHLIQ